MISGTFVRNIEVNETTPRVPLRVEFQPTSYFKFQIFASLGFGFNEAAKQQGGAGTAKRLRQGKAKAKKDV